MWGIVASLIYLPISLSGIIFFAHPLPGYEGIVLIPGIAGLVAFVNGPARKQDRGNVTAQRTQKMDTFMSGLSTPAEISIRSFRDAGHTPASASRESEERELEIGSV